MANLNGVFLGPTQFLRFKSMFSSSACFKNSLTISMLPDIQAA
eukprot:03447.XXX_17357_17485_1 [CDS] Oithona nana genome sequencing.